MPLQETFVVVDDALIPGGLANGKVDAGVTLLRDPQTGWLYDVLHVASGKLPTPIDVTVDRHGPSAAGRCAMYGGPVRELRKEP